MAVKIIGTTSGQEQEVDSTSKAARVSIYDNAGNLVSASSKTTYHAAIAATTTGVGTGVFFNIIGSASKTIRVHRIGFSGTVGTAATNSTVVLSKRATATTAGTATTLTAIANDSASGAATAVTKFFTALGTAGTGGGALMARMVFMSITATPTYSPGTIIFLAQEDTGAETQDFVLRGTGECLELAFAATTSNTPTLSVYITWSEE